MLADEGKCKVWSHEENQVGNKRDHLGLIWFDLTKDDDKLYFIVCVRPGGGIIPQAVGLQGPDVVAHNNTRRGDRGNTC